MKLQMSFPLKPISLNDSHTYGKFRKFKKKTTRDFEKEVTDICLLNRAKLEKFNDKFDKTVHAIRVDYTYLVPKKNLYTKKGHLSQRCFDWDNPNKILQDPLFKTIGIDDAFIYSGHARKLPSPHNKYVIMVTIEMVDLMELEIESLRYDS